MKSKVVWVGTGKVVPKYGVMEVGRVVDMSADDAESFIKQGMVEQYESKPPVRDTKRKPKSREE